MIHFLEIIARNILKENIEIETKIKLIFNWVRKKNNRIASGE